VLPPDAFSFGALNMTVGIITGPIIEMEAGEEYD